MFNNIEPTSSTAGASVPPKQIVIFGAVANVSLYVVPHGRVFKGHIYHRDSTSYYCYINGVNYYAHQGDTTYFAKAGALNELTLIAGTEVKEGATANVTTIFGVEYNA